MNAIPKDRFLKCKTKVHSIMEFIVFEQNIEDLVAR